MIAWLLGVLAAAAALTLGIERLLRRLGVRRTDPAGAPRGIDLVLDRLSRRLERARRRDE